MKIYFVSLTIFLINLLGCIKTQESVVVGEMNSYHDPTYGFKINYPKEWKIFHVAGNYIFAASQEVMEDFLIPQSGAMTAEVTIGVIYDNGKSLEEIFQEEKHRMKQQNFKLDCDGNRRDETYAVSGKQGRIIAYLLEPTSDIKIFGHQIFVQGNGVVYRLDFKGYNRQYGLHAPIFESMLNSFNV